jgi:hypothetical protein
MKEPEPPSFEVTYLAIVVWKGVKKSALPPRHALDWEGCCGRRQRLTIWTKESP